MQLAMRLTAQIEAGDLDGAAATADAALPLLDGVDDADLRLTLWIPTIQLRALRGDADGARALLAEAQAAAEVSPRAAAVVKQVAEAIGEGA